MPQPAPQNALRTPLQGVCVCMCVFGEGRLGFPGSFLISPPSLPNQQGFCSFKNGSPFLSLLGPRHWILADTQRKKPQSASHWAGVTPISTTGENPDDPGDRAQPSADGPRPDALDPLGGVSPTVPAEQETVSAVSVSVTLWGGWKRLSGSEHAGARTAHGGAGRGSRRLSHDRRDPKHLPPHPAAAAPVRALITPGRRPSYLRTHKLAAYFSWVFLLTRPFWRGTLRRDAFFFFNVLANKIFI